MKHWAVILALVLAALAGCRTETLSEEFIEDRTPRMEIKGYTTFLYDPLKCQIGFNQDKCEFRVHTDNMSDYYCVTLNLVPTAEGQKAKGDITWTSRSDVVTRRDLTFHVKKADRSGRLWLWCRKEQIGVVIHVLE